MIEALKQFHKEWFDLHAKYSIHPDFQYTFRFNGINFRIMPSGIYLCKTHDGDWSLIYWGDEWLEAGERKIND